MTSGNIQTETKNVNIYIFGEMETIKDTALATAQGCPIPTYVLDDLCR